MIAAVVGMFLVIADWVWEVVRSVSEWVGLAVVSLAAGLLIVLMLVLYLAFLAGLAVSVLLVLRTIL